MAIDPNIPLMVRTPQSDPIQTITQLTQLRNLGQQAQLRGAQLTAANQEIQERQQNIDDDKAYTDAFKNNTTTDPDSGKSTVDYQGALSDLAKKAPRSFVKLQSQVAGMNEQQHRTFKEGLDSTTAGIRMVGQVYGTVRDQPSLDAANAQITAALQGGPPQAQSLLTQLPQQYDPAAVQRIQQGAQTVEQQLEFTRQVAADARKGRGEKAKSAQEVRANAAGPLAVAAGQGFRQYQDAYHALDDDVAGQFPAPEQYGPTTANDVRRLGMTPEQQTMADLATSRNNQANTRNNIAMDRLKLEKAKFDRSPDRNDPAVQQDWKEYDLWVHERARVDASQEPPLTDPTKPEQPFTNPRLKKTPLEMPPSFKDWRAQKAQQGGTPPAPGPPGTTVPPATTAPAGAASPGKTVTVAQLQAIVDAKTKAGATTTLDEQRNRAISAGYAVVR